MLYLIIQMVFKLYVVYFSIQPSMLFNCFKIIMFCGFNLDILESFLLTQIFTPFVDIAFFRTFLDN